MVLLPTPLGRLFPSLPLLIRMSPPPSCTLCRRLVPHSRSAPPIPFCLHQGTCSTISSSSRRATSSPQQGSEWFIFLYPPFSTPWRSFIAKVLFFAAEGLHLVKSFCISNRSPLSDAEGTCSALLPSSNGKRIPFQWGGEILIPFPPVPFSSLLARDGILCIFSVITPFHFHLPVSLPFISCPPSVLLSSFVRSFLHTAHSARKVLPPFLDCGMTVF